MNKWCVTVVGPDVAQYGPFRTRIDAMRWAADYDNAFAGRKVIVHALQLIDVREEEEEKVEYIDDAGALRQWRR